MNLQDIKSTLISDWYRTLAEHNSPVSDAASISGAIPPSVFVGTYNYPRVYVGPMLPPMHGDTTIFDNPEKWSALKLGDIIALRLGMIRGIKQIPIHDVSCRYVAELQEVALSLKSSESDIVFDGRVNNESCANDIDGDNTPDGIAPFGPVGVVQSARFSSVSAPSRQIQNTYYDTDMNASDAMMTLYESGIAMSAIQRCLSMGMLGEHQNRKIVPTKWSITAADSIISSKLLCNVAEYDLIDTCKVFRYGHFGNIFAIVLFPHQWMFELVEAWYERSDVKYHDNAKTVAARHHNDVAPKIKTSLESIPRKIVFGSDWETMRVQRPPVNTAGAYYAAKLAVLEYLNQNQIQAGVLVLREITPEYSIPVGVWQVREGVRMALQCESHTFDNDVYQSIKRATSFTNIGYQKWLSHSHTTQLVKQRTISDYV